MDAILESVVFGYNSAAYFHKLPTHFASLYKMS